MMHYGATKKKETKTDGAFSLFVTFVPQVRYQLRYSALPLADFEGPLCVFKHDHVNYSRLGSIRLTFPLMGCRQKDRKSVV